MSKGRAEMHSERNRGNSTTPVVSVVMLAFNHEKYIRQAIESILNQTTSFPFELIIHDDASEDDTPLIIREYESRYPTIVKAIYQKENQYSKGVDLGHHFIYPMCRGKYFAYCEGDDYWIDCNKLEEQVEYLHKNDGCSAVYHNCVIVDESSNKISDYRGPYVTRNETDYDSFRLGVTGDYPGQTASALVRSSIFDLNDSEKRDLEKVRANGDKKILILAVRKGNIHVLPKVMSAHRVIYFGGCSWTASVQGKNLSGLVFRSNYDIRKFLKMHSPKNSYPNQYHLFHSAVALLVKAFYHASEADKAALQTVVEELGGMCSFLTYTAAMGFAGIPIRLFGMVKYR